MPATAPTPGPPPPARLLDTSPWAAGVAGLVDEAHRWLRELPAIRQGLERQALAIATPALHPAGIARLAELGARSVGAAGLWGSADLATWVFRSLVLGDRGTTRSQMALARAEGLVRVSGPVYVKLGQLIATSRGILPDEVVDAFAWCRDEVPPLPRGVARRRVEREFGAPVEEIFAAFDDEPMAAASIAQVHGARLHDGTEVVVKVRRPGLPRRFRSDIRALALLAAAAERRSRAARVANASGFVELFAQLVLEELDFRLEALNMVEVGLAGEHAGIEFVRCPRPVPGMVSERVLVMERLPGVRYTDATEILAAGVDPGRLLRLGIQGVLEHTLVYGAFHGDLHAGNVLVDSDGTFGLIDFGIMGRLDDSQRGSLIRFLMGLGTRDVRAQLQSLVEFGALPLDVDVDAIVATIEEARLERGSREERSVSHDEMAEGLRRVVQALVAHGFRLPKDLVLFFKNLLYLNGFAASLAPDLNLLGEIEPIFGYFQAKYEEQMGTVAGEA